MTLEAPWKTWKTPAGPALAVQSPKGPQPPHCMSGTAPCAATFPLPVPTNCHIHKQMYSGTTCVYSKQLQAAASTLHLQCKTPAHPSALLCTP